MKVAAVKAPGGLDRIVIEDRPEPVARPGEILMRVRASSLNFHDFAAVSGMIKVADGRIPMSDGAGEVVAVGEGVTAFKVGDGVLSTFFPHWPAGRPLLERLTGVPGDHVDGFTLLIPRDDVNVERYQSLIRLFSKSQHYGENERAAYYNSDIEQVLD